jgi:hypothetical protein
LREARIALRSFLYAGYNDLAAGDAAQYARRMKVARQWYDEYMKDKADRLSERLRLRPFVEEQIDALQGWFLQPAFTPGVTVSKARLWRALPLSLRQGVYDGIIEHLARECGGWDFDVAKAFLVPSGIEKYREQHPNRFKKERKDQTETLPQTIDT